MAASLWGEVKPASTVPRNQPLIGYLISSKSTFPWFVVFNKERYSRFVWVRFLWRFNAIISCCSRADCPRFTMLTNLMKQLEAMKQWFACQSGIGVKMGEMQYPYKWEVFPRSQQVMAVGFYFPFHGKYSLGWSTVEEQKQASYDQSATGKNVYHHTMAIGYVLVHLWLELSSYSFIYSLLLFKTNFPPRSCTG